MCVCVCVCVCDGGREGGRERMGPSSSPQVGAYKSNIASLVYMTS